MKTILESHGGTVEKFVGDAVMAVFGVPRVRHRAEVTDRGILGAVAPAEQRDRVDLVQ
jgi:class 3 adenylate cyclase